MFKKTLTIAILLAPDMASAQGAYLVFGGAVGSADMQGIEDSYGPGASLKTDDDVQRAIAGVGISVSPYLAFEGVYLSSVENTVKDSTDEDALEHSGIQLAVIGSASVTPQISLTAKLSANYMSTEYTYRISNLLAYSEEQRNTHLGIGVGVAFQANDAVALRFGYERIMMKDVVDQAFLGESGDVDLDQATLTLQYNF